MQSRREGGPRRSTRARGMTLTEIMVAITVLSVSLLAYCAAIGATIRNNNLTRETALATQAARRTIETLKATPFAQVFRLYNGDRGDDPGGIGTAPGRHVAVGGLQARPGDADGTVGEIIFPTPAPNSANLRENLVDTLLGTPRDLNGDGAIDALDHSGDYRILPVIVRMSWIGPAGPGRVEFRTLLADIP